MDTGIKHPMVSIVAAVADNGVIGRNGDLPWRLKSDLRRFQQLTLGHTVIVGRKTHEAILERLGHPLEGRRTIVVTRQVGYESECEVAHSFDEALAHCTGEAEVFVIGGAELYDEALVVGDKLYLTQVHTAPEGDAYFPWRNKVLWREVGAEEHPKDDENECATTFCVYERKVLTLPRDALPTFVNLDNVRRDDQRAVMEEIAVAGICPFCPEHRTRFPLKPPVDQGRYWVVVPNRWPYQFTKLHLMAVLNRHARTLAELSSEEWAEFHLLLSRVERQYHIESGAIGLRFGDPRGNGASVDHLHAHLIVADPDVTKPGYERVRFPMGPKPPAQEKAPDA